MKRGFNILIAIVILSSIVSAFELESSNYKTRFNIGGGGYVVNSTNFKTHFSVVTEPVSNPSSSNFIIYQGFYSPTIIELAAGRNPGGGTPGKTETSIVESLEEILEQEKVPKKSPVIVSTLALGAAIRDLPTLFKFGLFGILITGLILRERIREAVLGPPKKKKGKKEEEVF